MRLGFWAFRTTADEESCTRKQATIIEAWQAWRKRRYALRQERREIESPTPRLHRCGPLPETSWAHLLERISIEQWRDEANSHSKWVEETFEAATCLGARPEILNGYLKGMYSHAEMIQEVNRATATAEARALETVDAASEHDAYDRALKSLEAFLSGVAAHDQVR